MSGLEGHHCTVVITTALWITAHWVQEGWCFQIFSWLFSATCTKRDHEHIDCMVITQGWLTLLLTYFLIGMLIFIATNIKLLFEVGSIITITLLDENDRSWQINQHYYGSVSAKVGQGNSGHSSGLAKVCLLHYYGSVSAKVGRGNSGHSSGLAEVCLLHAKKIELQL